MLIPITYNLRSLFVRHSSTMLTVFGIGATVAIVAGVLALRAGFTSMFTAGGRDDIAVLLRPGATGETDSVFSRDRGLKAIKTSQEIAVGSNDQPLASMECYVAILHPRIGGGETNVPIRGVQPMTFELRGDEIRIVDGRIFAPGADELIVGKSLVDRIQDCHVGDVLQINTVPFRVVGTFDHDGAFASEIWGDLDRLLSALERYGPNRIIAKVKPDVVIGYDDGKTPPEPGSFAARMKEEREVPAKVSSERVFLASQTQALSVTLLALGVVLGVIMGVAAIFTATNTMLAALAARTHEIGILLAMGFRPLPIFLSFMFEALVLGLMGGLVGCLMALPLNGVRTGTMNFQTFTEFAFAFRVTPGVLLASVSFSLILGLLGGAIPAWRAARMRPTEAMRAQ